uniref:t-SNARE coiled-coil homology domain-containing protein n=1 Tax=Neobodo designis TaxID=312471 RepID=A0A7S1QA08_NEODS|mmetsp:Transcript_36766/g.113400  ORF Transcript_36766/g.113400 Transcript_36766/m.113400 type:complete len:283 (+) Transcript_36766:225-1073(+)
MPAEAYYTMKRLEKLAVACGVSDKNKEEQKPDVDLSKMSPFERQQYQTAVIMQRVRSNIMELDNCGEKASLQKKSELSQSIRRDIDKIRKETGEAKKLARDEGKKAEYETLLGHVKKTEALYKQRFQAQGAGGEEAAAAAAFAAGSQKRAVELDQEMSQLGQPMVNLREDEEFAMFFEQVQQNDQKMDEALDRISAGVQVLHNQATNINQELKVQNQLLEETEEKVDKVHGKLKTLNKRLKKTIKDVEKDRLCIYLICFILLLALGGIIYWQITKGDKKKSD